MKSDGRLCSIRPHLFNTCIAKHTFMKPIRPHVGLSVVWIWRLSHHEGPAVWTHSQAARASAAVGGGSQSVADEAAGRAGEFENAVGVGVGDEDVS